MEVQDNLNSQPRKGIDNVTPNDMFKPLSPRLRWLLKSIFPRHLMKLLVDSRNKKHLLVSLLFVMAGIIFGLWYLSEPPRHQDVQDHSGEDSSVVANALQSGDLSTQASDRNPSFPAGLPPTSAMAGGKVPDQSPKIPAPPSWINPIRVLPDAEQPTFRDDAESPPSYEVKRVILSEDKPLDGASRFLRTQLVETNMKYPFLRVQEEIRIEGHARDEFIVSRVATVATHVIVEAMPGRTSAMEAWAGKRNKQPMRSGPASPIYLMPVSMASLDDLPQAIEDLRKEAATFALAEPDYIVQPLLSPNDANFGSLWALNNSGQSGGVVDADIDAVEAWQIANPASGASLVVGVIDTGIDYNHPDLAANIWINTDEIAGNGIDDDGNGYVDDRRGWDFANNDNDPMDDHFHGTHVAGTIGAVGNNAAGVAGVIWNAKLMPLKFLGVNGGTTSDAIEAIDYATANGCRLTNNSWGGGGMSQSLSNAIQRAQDAGVLFVAAAGNSAQDIDANPSYPAAYPQSIVLSVASSTHGDVLSGFSNYGVRNVDVVAPGSGILSTFPTTVTSPMGAYGLPANYATISGTSMAAPHVAGLAALLWAHQPGMSAETVKMRIMTRGDLLPATSTRVMSGRRINASATVLMSGTEPPAELLFSSVKATFSSGNGDESLNPGETIQIVPELMNFGGVTAQPVSVEVVPQSPGLTVSRNAVADIPGIALMERGSPSSALRVDVASNLADNTRIQLQLIARWQNGQQISHTYRAVVSKQQPISEVEIDWLPGEPVADTTRERVYVMDRTNLRVLALNTANGSVAAWGGLAGSSQIAPPVENGSLRTGMLAVSHDGSKLWAALTSGKIIQCFNLPDLTPAGTFHVDFSPVCLAQAANGRLFATSTDYWGPIREIDPASGAHIRIFDKHNGRGTYYMHSLLRLGANGTRLFVGQTGLRTSGGPGFIDEFDVSGTASPGLVASQPYWQLYMKDFEVDSLRQRIYTANALIRGIQITETKAGGDFGDVWPFLWPGASVELPPGSSTVYGATDDVYEGEISRFDAEDGARIERNIVGTDARYLPSRSLAVTPGGCRFYVKSLFTGDTTQGVAGTRYFLAMMGSASLDLSSLPPPTPTPPDLLLTNVDFSDVDANRDGNAAPGETIRLLPRFRNAGGLAATGISVSCSTSVAGVSVQAPSSQGIADMAAYSTGAPASEFRLNIGANVPDGTVVDVTFTSTYSGTFTSTASWRFNVRTVIPNTMTTAHGALGGVIADKTRNIVYLQDRQNRRILAIDTNLGAAIASCSLVGPAKVGNATVPPALGDMALSTDGTKLYVAIRDAKMIQVISLPEFTTLTSWTFDFGPTSLATDALGRIYASGLSGQPRQIDGNTGNVLGSFGYNSPSILRSSADGAFLFVPLYGQVRRFDTSGSGLPVLVSTSDITIRPSYTETSDFFWDHRRQRALNAPGGPNLKVATLTGTVTDWATTSNVNSVTMDPAGTQVWTGISHSRSGIVRIFDADTGVIVRDLAITTGTSSLIPAGLAVTPNGRAVYVVRQSGSSSTSVDGFSYRVGIIGSGLADLDLPVSGGRFAIKSVTFADPSPAPNNNDGYAGPGETVRLTPLLKNQAVTSASNVQLTLLSASANATVTTTGAVSVGTMAPYGNFTPASPFQVTINSAASDGEEILLKFRISRDGGADELIEHKLAVFRPDTVRTATLSYQLGEIIADPARNLVYMVDKTNSRILCFNTDTNNITAAVPLAGTPGAGHMEISADHTRLYVALTGARKLQVFRLPELTQADVVDVNFDIHSIALGVDGNIYASSTDNSGYLRKVDPLTGEVLASFNKGYGFYPGAIVRISPDRSRLFAFEVGLSGSGECPEWDILKTPPVLTASHSFSLANTMDLRVDERYRRLYFASGGVYGIGVTEMDSGLANILWPNNVPAHGRGVAFLPDSRFAYGLSSGSITRFNRANGARVGRFDVATTTNDAAGRGLAITPNGRMVFVRNPTTGNHVIGVIGGAAINITLPVLAPTTYAGVNLSLQQDHSIPLGTSVVNAGTAGALTHTWRLIDGPTDAVFSSTTAQNTVASFNAPGRYLVEVKSSSGGTQSSDILVLDVAGAPAEVSVTASQESASPYKKLPGEFTFTRQGGNFTQPLVVKFATSGTAVPGTHFEGLGNSITIPAGQTSVTKSVTISATTLVSPVSVVSTLVGDPAYVIGDYREASVMLRDGSFTTWRQIFLSDVPPAASEPLADADGDGRVNLLEYALGTDPKIMDQDPALDAGLDTAHGLCLTYTIPAGSSAIYTVETSTALDTNSWRSGAGHTQEVSRITNANGSVTVKEAMIKPDTDGKSAFIRLKVSL